MKKLPAVYIYKKTSDQGEELKYSIRSLQNVKNWNGQVFVVGDKEAWFSDHIVVIEDFTRSHIKWIDQQNKLRSAIEDKRIAEEFIYFNDDMYITERKTVKPLFDGELQLAKSRNGWVQAKANTKSLIEREHHIHNPKNYDIHVPIIFNKQKLSAVLDEVERHPDIRLQPRSIYGNVYQIGGKQYKDRKTKTSRLLKGEFLSTRIFCKELKTMFPKKSEFEK